MGNPYCSGTILVLKPVKWGKLFSKVHFFKAFPFSKVHFFRYSYVHFDLYSNVWSIFRQKMTKYVVEYIYYINFCVLATALLGFEISSLAKNVLVLVLIHLESLSKNRTLVKFFRTMGGFDIFQNHTIAKSVLIKTVLWGDPHVNCKNGKFFWASNSFQHLQ